MKLQKIGDISQRYNITSRALRYYEEIGLLESTRGEDSQYRLYDEKAVARMEQILLLRRLQLATKDIRQILSTGQTQVLVGVLNDKLREIRQESDSLAILCDIIEEFLSAINKRDYSCGEVLKLLEEKTTALDIGSEKKREVKKPRNMEDLRMVNENINKLTDVRIIRLRSTKVAYYKAVSDSPEEDAWKVMLAWVRENGLEGLFTTRYFGFNNPSPEQGNPVYGYEVWVTVGDDVKESGAIKIKAFDGGLYAVTSTYLNDIGENWQKLDRWVKESKYSYNSGLGLEEHILNDESSMGPNMQLDLYYPVKE